MHLKYRPNDSENGASHVTAKSKQTTSDTSWGNIVLYCLKQITGNKFTMSFYRSYQSNKNQSILPCSKNHVFSSSSFTVTVLLGSQPIFVHNS